jgi:hypothetical protein
MHEIDKLLDYLSEHFDIPKPIWVVAEKTLRKSYIH